MWRRHVRKPERTQYAWSGLQMVGETSDSHPDAAVQYIYTENSYEPLARVDSHSEHADIFWYHTELNGLPDSVTDSNGDTVWRGASTAWGRSLRESTPVEWDTLQNLRFQGQYLDRETGLHYNTFRYYDPAGGGYTEMDPIGLAGGLNTYTYVVDPLELARMPCGPLVRKINGRRSINSASAGKMYPIEKLPIDIRSKYQHSVPFNHAGFPDFSQYSIKNVFITLGKSRYVYFGRADIAAGYSPNNPSLEVIHGIIIRILVTCNLFLLKYMMM
nr:RHS repeat-associated core domain-containing protein [Kosakonia cowanii]